MAVLVTGAGGMLGRDVVAAAGARGVPCTAMTHAELDITDAGAVSETVSALAPEAIVNCAAWTDVDGAEQAEHAATALNAHGPAHLARAACAAGARLVHLSTDYVFDGSATRPYVESDATAPSTAYGRTKLAGERAVLEVSSQHVVARTAWLFGLGRSNFVAWVLEQAAAGRPVAAFTDQSGCPTYTVHLAAKLLDLAAGDCGGVFHVAAAGHCSRFAFAEAILTASGLATELVATSRSALPAPRPAWSVLTSERDRAPLPSWRDGLDAYLAERRAPR